MTFQLLPSCEILLHWYGAARILWSWEHADPAYPGHTAALQPSAAAVSTHCMTSCSALSSVWHIANSAVILQLIDSVASNLSMRCRAMFRNFLQDLSRGSGWAPWRPWRGGWPPVTSLHPWPDPDPGPGPASHWPVVTVTTLVSGMGEKGRMLRRDGVELSAVCCPTQGWEPGRLFLGPLSTTNCTEMEDDGTKYF